MSSTGDDTKFRVRFAAEVRKAPAPDSALFHTVRAGKVVEQLGLAVIVAGVRRVPLLPRGWIDADALEPFRKQDPGAAANARPTQLASNGNVHGGDPELRHGKSQVTDLSGSTSPSGSDSRKQWSSNGHDTAPGVNAGWSTDRKQQSGDNHDSSLRVQTTRSDGREQWSSGSRNNGSLWQSSDSGGAWWETTADDDNCWDQGQSSGTWCSNGNSWWESQPDGRASQGSCDGGACSGDQGADSEGQGPLSPAEAAACRWTKGAELEKHRPQASEDGRARWGGSGAESEGQGLHAPGERDEPLGAKGAENREQRPHAAGHADLCWEGKRAESEVQGSSTSVNSKADMEASLKGGNTQTHPAGAEPPTPPQVPTAAKAQQLVGTDGAHFRVCYDAEIRQGPLRTSAMCNTCLTGKLVQQMGTAFVLEDGTHRVPLAPRGWIDADALEPYGAPPGGHGVTICATDSPQRQVQPQEQLHVRLQVQPRPRPQPQAQPQEQPRPVIQEQNQLLRSSHTLLSENVITSAPTVLHLEERLQPTQWQQQLRPQPGACAAATSLEQFQNSPQAYMEPKPFADLNEQIVWKLQTDFDASEMEKSARRVQTAISGMVQRLDPNGSVEIFGSYTNGFRTGGSDLDVVYDGDVGPDGAISMLENLVKVLPDFGCDNIVRIFQARIPLVKFTDIASGIEVDFCLRNKLGVRNSQLLGSYGRFDARVHQLGTLVKMWAKGHELVGTADGFLNSYAYALLTIHYLQSVRPPVVPNLQQLATESVPISDSKWCSGDVWETKFVEDVASLPLSENRQSIAELLVGFFRFYGHLFDWQNHAVCPRLNQPGTAVDKYSLLVPITEEQWYIEDPFDLKHNLGGQSTDDGRKRILAEMQTSFHALNGGGHWCQVCPPGAPAVCYLKTRVGRSCTPEVLLKEFTQFNIEKIHFPLSDSNGQLSNAFLEFKSAAARRRAHTKNETYVGDTQLLLFYSSPHALAASVEQGNYCTYGLVQPGDDSSSLWVQPTTLQNVTGLHS